MKHLRSLLAVLLFITGTVSAMADSYVTIDGVKYHIDWTEPESAYVCGLLNPPRDYETVTIPKTIEARWYFGSELYTIPVLGFEKNVQLPATTNIIYLELPEDFNMNGADLSKVNISSITWLGKLGALNGSPMTYNQYKVYFKTFSDETLARAVDWHKASYVTMEPVLNGDYHESYSFEEKDDEHTPAYVTQVNLRDFQKVDEIIIPDIKYDKRGIFHPVRYWGAPDVCFTNKYPTIGSITFEGPITLYDNFFYAWNLKKISFKTIGDIDGVCSLHEKLIYSDDLEEIYFTGNTLPNLQGAATDYFKYPEKVTCYIKSGATFNGQALTPAELKTYSVWQAFKDIKVIGAEESYTLSVDAHNARGYLQDLANVYNGNSYSGELNVNTPVELYAYETYGDYTLTHCYVDGIDILPQMEQRSAAGVKYRYYKFEDGKDHIVHLEGEAQHTVFSKLMVHQSGEGTTTAIATLANGDTQELNLPQGTGYGILNVASKDVQKVEVRFFPVHDGKPTVYNGTQQIADEDVKRITYGNYYYTTLTQAQLRAGDFTVVYPVSYEQQEGTIKTTVAVRNFEPKVSYNFATGNETVNSTVDNNTTKDVYHQYATGGTYTIYINGYSNQFRIQENGEDKTSLAEEKPGYWTYTVQHPEQNGLIIVDDGFDMRMNMTTSASGIASFRYTDANGTQTKAFGNGTETYGISSKGRTNQELVVTTNVSFTLYRNGEDISSQYASSNVNADDATKRDYHFLAYGDQNALNFVDGETLNLVLVTAKSIPVMAKSNSVDSRGIKIETFRYGDNDAIVDLHTWGDMASAAVGGREYLKVYFYHTAKESFKELYINGHKYTGGFESNYSGEPENNNEAGYYAMRFSGVGSTSYSGDYNSLSLEAVFETEGGLDVTKANAVVSMSDESNKAFAELTFDIHRDYNDNTSVTETMRKGLKVFEMDKDRLDDNSYMEYVLYVPDGYEPKVYVEGLDYSSALITSRVSINGVFYDKCVLRFDSQQMPFYRSQNTSWLVNVTKAVSEARQWNITLFGAENAEAYVSFYDEVNANKESHRESILSKDISGNTTVNVPYNAVGASVSAKFYNPDIDVRDDYDFVVMADGQDISDQFKYGGENNFYCYNIDPSLLSANSWLIGFKAKNSTLVTHTATAKGDVDDNAVTLTWKKTSGSAIATYSLSSTTPNASSTPTEQPASCAVSVTLQKGYIFKAYFNEQPVTGFTMSSGKYTVTLEEPATTDGSWTFVFTKIAPHIIEFADAEVKRICVQYWDTDGDGELSTDEAAAVTTLNLVESDGVYYSVFNKNTKITSFDEFQYFTGITVLGPYAFNQCTNLTSIVLPPTIEQMRDRVFSYCTKLKRIFLPESLELIRSSVFYRTGLESVYIPKNVNSLYDNPFSWCDNLASITVAADNATFESPNGCNAIIEKSTNKLVAGCKNTVIPDGVTTIGIDAFERCKMTEIVLPASVTSINRAAFSYCSNLTSVIAKMDTPATLSGNPFYGISKNCVLTVPRGKKDAYIAAGWTEEIFKGGIVEEAGPGDANGDGRVSVTDIGVIVDMILGNDGGNAGARRVEPVVEPQ